jgi:hypothetical protein
MRALREQLSRPDHTPTTPANGDPASGDRAVDFKRLAAERIAEREAWLDARAAKQRAAAAGDRERRAAAQHAALDEQDRKAQAGLVRAFGQRVADRIDLGVTYLLFVIRGVGIAVAQPAPPRRPEGALLVGSRSPIYAVEQRLQRIANCGVSPPRLIPGRRLALDASVDLRAVDPDDDELRALIGATR